MEKCIIGSIINISVYIFAFLFAMSNICQEEPFKRNGGQEIAENGERKGSVREIRCYKCDSWKVAMGMMSSYECRQCSCAVTYVEWNRYAITNKDENKRRNQ